MGLGLRVGVGVGVEVRVEVRVIVRVEVRVRVRVVLLVRVPLKDRGDLVPQVHPVEPRLGQHRRVDNALLVRVRVRVRQCPPAASKGAGLGTRVWVRAGHVWLQAECLWLQAKLVSIGWRGVAWRVAWCVVLRVAWRVAWCEASPPRALRTALHYALHCTRPRGLLSPACAPT